MTDAADPLAERRASLVALFIDDHPMARALGMEFVGGDAETVVCRLPYRGDLANHENKGLAPGVLVTVIDATFGLSVMMRVPEPQAIATIQLKIDFIEGVEADCDALFNAECYAIADNVGYARGDIRRDDDGSVIAFASATFMLGTRGPEFFKKDDKGAAVE